MAKEVGTRRTRLAPCSWHWQEVGRGGALLGRQGNQFLTFWVLPLPRSSGVKAQAQVWGLQVVCAPQTRKSCSSALSPSLSPFETSTSVCLL